MLVTINTEFLGSTELNFILEYQAHKISNLEIQVNNLNVRLNECSEEIDFKTTVIDSLRSQWSSEAVDKIIEDVHKSGGCNTECAINTAL